MLKTSTTQIDGHDVTVTEFAGTRNLNLLLDLSILALPALAGVGQQTANPLDMKIDFGVVANAVLAGATRDKLTGLVARILEGTTVDGAALEGARFDALFAGPGIWLLPKIIKYALEVNYKNF